MAISSTTIKVDKTNPPPFRKPKRKAGIDPTPSRVLHVAGVGMRLGHSAEEVGKILKEVLQRAINEQFTTQIHMVAGASYCFVEFNSIFESERALTCLNKCDTVDSVGKRRVLSVTYAEYSNSIHQEVLCTSACSEIVPDGLSIHYDLISNEEEEILLNEIEGNVWNSQLARRTQQYGYTFNYGIRGIDFSEKTPPIPHSIQKLVIDRLLEIGIVSNDELPNQVTVNEYEPGQGIASHIDTHSAFCHCIFSLTLSAGSVMDFKWPCPEMIGNRASKIRRADLLPDQSIDSAHASPPDPTVPIQVEGQKRYLQYLPRRSLLVMDGESRYEWTHGIPARKMDKVKGKLIARGRRVSLTLRRVLFQGETCSCGVGFCISSRSK